MSLSGLWFCFGLIACSQLSLQAVAKRARLYGDAKSNETQVNQEVECCQRGCWVAVDYRGTAWPKSVPFCSPRWAQLLYGPMWGVLNTLLDDSECGNVARFDWCDNPQFVPTPENTTDAVAESTADAVAESAEAVVDEILEDAISPKQSGSQGEFRVQIQETPLQTEGVALEEYQYCNIPEAERKDCLEGEPKFIDVESECEQQGCCWQELEQGSTEPSCYTRGSSTTDHVNLIGDSRGYSWFPEQTMGSIPGYGTKYWILKTGSIFQNKHIQAESNVTVHATGFIKETGEKFWSTKDPGQRPFKYQAGVGQVITGLDQGLMGMRKGERRKLIIPSSEGYGSKGFPAWGIRPNAVLDFTMECLEID